MPLTQLNLKATSSSERQQALIRELSQENYHFIQKGQKIIIWLEDENYWQSSAKLFQIAFRFSTESSLPQVVDEGFEDKPFAPLLEPDLAWVGREKRSM